MLITHHDFFTDYLRVAPISNDTDTINYWKQMISDEIANITADHLQLDTETDDLYYTCQNIFQNIKIDKLMLGKDVLSPPSNAFEVIYRDGGLSPRIIQPTDVFTRSGSFVKIIKKFFFDNNSNLLHKKYIESNTYSKTLKLGVKLKYKDDNKRTVHYINLKESLEIVKKELGRFESCTSPIASSFSVDDEDESRESLVESSRSVSSKRQRTSILSSSSSNTFERTDSNANQTNMDPTFIINNFGLIHLESDIDTMEREIGDIVNKLDLLKAQDRYVGSNQI